MKEKKRKGLDSASPNSPDEERPSNGGWLNTIRCKKLPPRRTRAVIVRDISTIFPKPERQWSPVEYDIWIPPHVDLSNDIAEGVRLLRSSKQFRGVQCGKEFSDQLENIYLGEGSAGFGAVVLAVVVLVLRFHVVRAGCRDLIHNWFEVW
jgi:hypothetical protein